MSDLYGGLKVYTSEELATQIAEFERVSIHFEGNTLFVGRYQDFYSEPLPHPVDIERVIFRVRLFSLIKQVRL